MLHHAIQLWPGTFPLPLCIFGLRPVLIVESLAAVYCSVACCTYTSPRVSHVVRAAATMPSNEFSDVYNEVGPDNVGGMGDEPSCSITLFMLKEAAKQGKHGSDASTTQDTSGGAKHDAVAETECTAQQGMDAQHLPQGTAAATNDGDHKDGDQQSSYVAVDQVACDPHKVVALRPGQHNQMLLGLSSDVDCATVAFSCSGKSVLEPQHCHSIPALAYVAAGLLHSPVHACIHVCIIRERYTCIS